MSTPTVAVLDSNGIISLSKANCFPLLQNLFAEICVPPAVVAEITTQPSQNALQNALGKWLTELLPSADALREVAFINQEADRHVLALAIDRQASIPRVDLPRREMIERPVTEAVWGDLELSFASR